MTKSIYKLVMALFAIVAFTACSDSDNDYQKATVTGNQVYFANTLPSTINISFDESTFEIPILRYVADEAITVNLELEDTTGFYSIPASVSFAQGEKEAKIVVTYDNEALEYNKYIEATVKITSAEYTTPYGNSSYTFSAGTPLTYTPLGTGTFIDSWFGANTKVEIQQCDQKPNEYRIFKPYLTYDGDDYFLMTGVMDNYLEITLLHPGDELAGVTITQEDLVRFPIYSSGAIHPSYADYDPIWLVHPSSFSNLATEDKWLHNRVVEYQDNGQPGMIQLAPYFYINTLGGWNNTQNDGIIEIYFPGFDPKDFDLAVDYAGVLTSVSGDVFAVANVEAGADVASLKAAIVAADKDYIDVAFGIADGSIEAEEIASGNVNVAIPEGLTGKLQLVVAGFDVEGELVSAETAEFEYYGGGANPWESNGFGNYIYTMVFANSDGSPYVDEGLELQYNSSEDVYRITNWGYGVDFTFTFNKETNIANVPAQATGWTHSNYGPVFVGESDDYAGEEGWDDDDDGVKDPDDGPSYYDPDTQTFHFNVAYYVSAGYFDHGEETFTLTADQARSLMAATKNGGISVNEKLQLRKTNKAAKKAHRALYSNLRSQKLNRSIRL